MGILIVDDSSDSRELLKAMLKKAGYTDIQTAASASEALEKIGVGKPGEKSGVPDLVLMDVVMPDMDGIEASRKIKADKGLEGLPIVMVTAVEETQSLQDAFDAGAMDYITKPVKKAELLVRVRSVLGLKSEMDQRKARERDLMEANAKLEDANRTLERLSSMDGLTGLSNRRHFDGYLENEWKRGARNKTPLALLMIDIDHFKAYNDHYGHQGGDDCLKAVAKIIGKSVRRPADLAARYGGEEFVMVLPETEIEGAVTLAEKIRMKVEAARLPHAKSSVSEVVTISLGVADVIPEQCHNHKELIEAADKALYGSKRGGRNRVTRAEQADGITGPPRTA